MSFTDIIKLRRSRYELTDRLPISEEKLTEIIGQCILHTPSAFNSQPARVVLLLGEKHKQLWKLTEECLREIVPADKFAPTEKKLASFSAIRIRCGKCRSSFRHIKIIFPYGPSRPTVCCSLPYGRLWPKRG